MSAILDQFGQAAVLDVQTSTAPTSSSLYQGSQDTSYRQIRPKLDRDLFDILPQVRHRAMISDSRWIYGTGGGMVAGAVHQKADRVVGKAWKPQYLGRHSQWKSEAEALISQWVKICDVRGAPFNWAQDWWIGSKSIDVDGDFFIFPTFGGSDGKYPLLQFIEAHRIGQRAAGLKVVTGGRYDGAKIRNGIIYNRFNRPIAYNLLGETSDEDRTIRARDVIHVFDPKWFSQGRGIPTVANSILDWYDVSEIRNAEKIGVKANSKLAIVEKNATGKSNTAAAAVSGAGFSKENNKLQEEVIADGLIRYLKSSGDIQAHTSARPGQTWEGFMDHIIRGAFMGMDWPFEVAWSMSGIAGPAVRSVIQKAQRSVENRQGSLITPTVSALLHGVQAFINNGDLDFVDDWYEWGVTMPPQFSIDVGRDSENARKDYIIGRRNMEDLLEEDGKDEEEHYRRRARSWKLREQIAEEEDVPMHIFGIITPNGNAPQEAAAGGGPEPEPDPKKDPDVEDDEEEEEDEES